MSELEYNGLGFPVYLKRVETHEIAGETLPIINHRELEDKVFRALLWAPAHFSSAQLMFVRGYMNLSQKKFATLLGLKTHSTVSGWESKGEAETGMPVTAEIVIRLLMADFINEKGFASKFKEYLDINSPPAHLEVA